MRPLGTALIAAVLLLAFWPAISSRVDKHTLQPIEVMVAIVLGFVVLRLFMASRTAHASCNQPPSGQQPSRPEGGNRPRDF